MVDAPTPPRRRWFQDNPHAIIWIGLILLIFGGIAALATWLQPVLRHQSAIERIVDGGGSVESFRYAPSLVPEWISELLRIKHNAEINRVTIESDSSAVAIRDLPGFYFLYLKGPRVSDSAMEHLIGCNNIRCLDIIDTRITAAGLTNLMNMPSLNCLCICSENINDEWLKRLHEIGVLQRIKSLQFNDYDRVNKPYFITDIGLKYIITSVHLTELDISNSKITDEGLEHIKGLSSLSCLSLDNTDISDAGMENLKCLTSLRILSLDGTKITDAGLESIKNMAHLVGLNLNNTDISDAGIQHIKGLREIRRLSLDDTRITDAGLSDLAGLLSLNDLNVTNTKVTREGVERFKKALPECKLYCENLVNNNGESDK